MENSKRCAWSFLYTCEYGIHYGNLRSIQEVKEENTGAHLPEEENSMYKYDIIETEARGKANKDVILTWLFEENGTLSIFGAGMLPDYKDGQDRPWQEYADQVTALVVDDGITTIGARTFAGYEKLESVKLPASMSRIGFRAFAGCKALKTVTAPKKIAHSYSTNVATASRGVIREDTIYMGMQSFANTPWVVETFGDFYIHRDVLVEYYGNGGEVVVPDGIREIGISAFEGSAVTDVKLPETLRVINAFAFNNTPIRSVALPAALRKADRYSFGQTACLESILVGNPNMTIEALAFWKSAAEAEVVLNKKDRALIAKQDKLAAALRDGGELTEEQQKEAAEGALALEERAVWKEAVKMNVIPADDEWESVYHIESVREAGMDPFKKMEIRRDKKKMFGLSTLEYGKAILKKLSIGGPVMRICVNRENGEVEFVQSFLRESANSYVSCMCYPRMEDGVVRMDDIRTSYLTKSEMEELAGIGLWAHEANSGRFWFQAPKGTGVGVDAEMKLLKIWLSKHPGHSVKQAEA